MKSHRYRSRTEFATDELLETLETCVRLLPPDVDPIHLEHIEEINRRLYPLLVCG